MRKSGAAHKGGSYSRTATSEKGDSQGRTMQTVIMIVVGRLGLHVYVYKDDCEPTYHVTSVALTHSGSGPGRNTGHRPTATVQPRLPFVSHPSPQAITK